MTQHATNSRTSEWVQHAIFWHVYPLGFTGAEARAQQDALRDGVAHRLSHLDAWLDYMVELGCSALALGPIFASESHGYDTIDHFRIDPRLGDDADFERLVGALHARGLRLVLDGVFNHVGRSFPRLAEVISRGDAAPCASWFRRGGQDFATFEGHASLVTLNHAEPQVADYVCDVMNHWLRRGADGFRLDAAYAVPAAFWQSVLPRVRAEHANAWFVGEVIHGDYLAIVARAGFDSVTQYELWKAVWSSLNDANFFELAWALQRHDKFVEQFAPQTFVGNHDVTRIASKLKDLRRLPHALVVLFSVAGVPSIYAGDEQAFRGVKEERAGGDDEIRPAFPHTPAELMRDGWPIYRLHQALIGLRRRNAWLHRARLTVDSNTNEVCVYTCRHETQHLSVVLNISERAFSVPRRARSILASSAAQAGAAAESLTVEPHGWLICEFDP